MSATPSALLRLRRLSLMALFGATLIACSSNDAPVASTPPPPPAVNTGTVSTGTGAFGVLGTANARVAFIPAGNLIIPVVLETQNNTQIVADSSAKSSLAISQAPTLSPATFSFNIDACSVDSNDLKAICIGYASTKIAMLDLKTFATSFKVSDITVTEFDSGTPNIPNSYSGGSCSVCGVAADVGKQRFVIGGTGGFRVFNYASTTVAATYSFPVGENFALLPQAASISYVIAPEYAPNGGQRKLRVINLDTGKTYAWNKATDNITDLGVNANNFQYQDVDAAAVDLATGMIVLSSESSGDMLLVDFRQASINETSLTFSAPHTIKKPTSPIPRQTDVAISTKDSLLLTHGEFTGDIGVMQLPTASGTTGAFPNSTATIGAFSLTDPALDAARTVCSPTGTSYFYFSGKGDPHGLSLFTGLNSSQKGLIIDSTNTCAAIVDLKGPSTATRTTATSADIDPTAVGFSNLVKFVKLK
jgi:hypothetical protein